ncbi:hypothetical protein ANCCAN_28184 [Ancylostoma caninum]|uniref:Uncharacterized protein n=1 Tax=Ancylostoma caninum TaxID=29170 RepID=A0A368F1X2_ANCCA|nr:hypothetical protein ANCCAN_28184 [Ancylostoma caninum]
MSNSFVAESSQERKQIFQDSINKKVVLEWVRVTGLPNPRKKPFDRILQELAVDILKYPREKPIAFSWPTAAGMTGNILAIRAKISYDFWRFFITEGRGLLAEYNKTNNLDIRINREQTLTVSDNERLGESMTPTMAAVQFGINLEAWNGLPLDDLLTQKEKDAIKRGDVKLGSLRLTGVNLTKSQSSKNTSENNKENCMEKQESSSNSSESPDVEVGRKRPTSGVNNQDDLPAKMPKV